MPASISKHSDKFSLEELYNSTLGFQWKNRSNWASDHSCGQWFGVKVNAEQRVTAVRLNDNNCVGILPDNITLLYDLQSLDLSANMISGKIPIELGSLESLEELNLQSNLFTGNIPKSIADLSKLKVLNLSNNHLSGELDEAVLNHFTRMKTARSGFIVRLNGNNGFTLPSQFSNELINSMAVLDLSSCSLTGSIPDSLGSLTNLGILNLRENQLQGALPAAIGKLTQLEDLQLGQNALGGELPSAVVALLNIMKTKHGKVDLSGNLGFTLPADLGRVLDQSITALDLSSCSLTGPIPDSLGDLTQLRSLNLGSNELNGSIPASIGNLTALKDLYIGHNNLSGYVPPAVLQLKSTARLDFRANPGLSELQVETKELDGKLAYLFCLLDIASSYSDIISDLLSIFTFGSEGSFVLMAINVAFVMTQIVLGLSTAESTRERLFTVLLLGPLMNGLETLKAGRETHKFVIGKKLDVINRSMPSSVLQLTGILVAATSLKKQSIAILALSVAFGFWNTALTLAQMAPKAASSMLKARFGVLLVFYVAEVTLRLATISMAFASMNGAGCFVIAFDFCVRLWLCAYRRGPYELRVNKIVPMAFIFCGTDFATGDLQKDRCGFALSSYESLFFVVLLSLQARLSGLWLNGVAPAMIAVLVISWAVKAALWPMIESLPVDVEEGGSQLTDAAYSVAAWIFDRRKRKKRAGIDRGDDRDPRGGSRAEGVIVDSRDSTLQEGWDVEASMPSCCSTIFGRCCGDNDDYGQSPRDGSPYAAGPHPLHDPSIKPQVGKPVGGGWAGDPNMRPTQMPKPKARGLLPPPPRIATASATTAIATATVSIKATLASTTATAIAISTASITNKYSDRAPGAPTMVRAAKPRKIEVKGNLLAGTDIKSTPSSSDLGMIKKTKKAAS